MSQSEDLYQIALLIDQLKHDDLQLRLLASKSLCKIAKALGPERTRDELIPFLTESTDDEDDVLQIISEMLGQLREFVGGKEHVYTLLEPLECLAAVEEGKVRESAIASVKLVVNSLPDEHLKEHFVPFIGRLARKDWFTSRTSAVALIHTGYPRLSQDDKSSIQALFIRLCSDDTPTVRRAAAQNFAELSLKVNSTDLTSDLATALNSLMTDEQESVRIQAILACVAMFPSLSATCQSSVILPTIISASSDPAWRIRWTLGSRVHVFMSHAGSTDTLLPIYVNLLSDSESEVRAEAAATVYLVAKNLDKATTTQKIFPQLKKLASDSAERVRASLALSLNDISEVIGKDATIEELLPLLLAFLRDESSDVRLNVIANLEKLNKIVGVELLGQSLLPAIIELSSDPKWRVRTSIIEYMPILAKQIGISFFKEKLCELCLSWLKDNIFSVRKAAAKNLQALAKEFGEDWTCSEILPAVEKMSQDSGCVQRIMAVTCYQLFLGVFGPDKVKSKLVPPIIKLTSDVVPNVRCMALKALDQYVKESSNCPADAKTEIRSCIEKLLVDPDRDVKFHAKKVSSFFSDSFQLNYSRLNKVLFVHLGSKIKIAQIY